jgi:hypothetical protein
MDLVSHERAGKGSGLCAGRGRRRRPTGIAAATLLGKFGIQTLVLDRWADVYPQPCALHANDEVFRILAALGVRDQFAAISRPALGLRLLDPNMLAGRNSPRPH